MLGPRRRRQLFVRQRGEPPSDVRRSQPRERGQIGFAAQVGGHKSEEAGQRMAVGLDGIGGRVAFLFQPAKECDARSLAGHRRDWA